MYFAAVALVSLIIKKQNIQLSKIWCLLFTETSNIIIEHNYGGCMLLLGSMY
jgi:hypothetical protein